MDLLQIESLKRVTEGSIYVKFKISFDEFVLVNIVYSKLYFLGNKEKFNYWNRFSMQMRENLISLCEI